MKDKRPDKENNWIDIAAKIAERSPCINRRQMGAIIVVKGIIVSTGYNGSARGCINCGIETPCLKILAKEPPLKSYNYCCAVHAEENAIINAARSGISILGGTLYLAPSKKFQGKLKDNGRPCFRCRRYSINVGLKDCWYYDNIRRRPIYETIEWWQSLEDSWIREKLKEAYNK